MFLAEPQPTSADWHFAVAGVRVRVSAWFWLAAALLGWNACRSMAGGDQRMLLQMLVIWIGVVFVSILVHEMGHALAYRAFGQGAHIVLYHFGGLAIPEAWGRRMHLRPLQRLVVAAAGPLAQLALALAIVVGLKGMEHAVPFPIESLGVALRLYDGTEFTSPWAHAACFFLLSVNIFWPLLNLVPVPPLDGGQIVREGLLAVGIADAHRIAGMIGVAAGAAVAWWGYTRNEPYLGIMFAMLAASCFQGLSAGDPPWKRWN
jgi:Zn-dependent protease